MNNTVTFRSVTPLFNFEMEEGQEFHHTGQLNTSTFNVTVKKYPSSPDGFLELTKYAVDDQRKSLTSIHIAPNHLFVPADYFVVVDVTQPISEGLETRGNTTESVMANHAILDSLRLNASKGIDRFNTYHWREPQALYGGTHTSSQLKVPYLFSLLRPGPSVLPPSTYENCRAVAHILMEPWDDTNAFDRIMHMAMAYHEMASASQEPNLSFLLLMIIFEAMFKGRGEYTTHAVPRLANLLARNKNHRNFIIRQFDHGDLSYIKIRDDIAHGDVELNSEAVKGSYPGLYEFVTSAMTQLLLMRHGIFDTQKDYYEELSRVSQERFMNL
jgi:hypothetical protein